MTGLYLVDEVQPREREVVTLVQSSPVIALYIAPAAQILVLAVEVLVLDEVVVVVGVVFVVVVLVGVGVFVAVSVGVVVPVCDVSRALRVIGPTLPSGTRPLLSWNDWMACIDFLPITPSTTKLGEGFITLFSTTCILIRSWRVSILVGKEV